MERDASKTCTCGADTDGETKTCTCGNQKEGYEEATYTMTESIIRDALIKHAEGHIAKHVANIEVYLNSSTGIGEHSDIVDAIEGELNKLGKWHGQLELLNTYF